MMGQGHFAYHHIFYLAFLIFPVLGINHLLGIKISKKICLSLSRMILQLAFVGLYLQYIFDLNNPWLNLTYLVVMMIIANFSVIGSCNLKVTKLFWPLLGAMVVPNLYMVFFFNGLVVRIDNIVDARYVITIGGMLLGNVLKGDIIGLSAFYKNIRDNLELVQYDFCLGATPFQATLPYLRDALVRSVEPTLASMATMGLVSLPGMVTGQILGGSLPSIAIMYQVAIMIAIFITKYANVILAILFSQKIMFDSRDMLVQENFK